MPTPADVATVIATMRTRLGDNTVGAYFADDATMQEFVLGASRELSTYYRKDVEDATTAGNNTSIYTIPTAVNPTLITDVWIRQNADPMTDRSVRMYRKHHGQIILPLRVSTSDLLVFWYHRAFIVGTDDIPEHVQEILYDLIARRWYEYGISRRSDWAQWASTNRSDTSIAQLTNARDVINRRITEIAATVGNTITVGEVGGGW